jgi:hypothetical protein
MINDGWKSNKKMVQIVSFAGFIFYSEFDNIK